jgi:phage gpG-like protein
MDGVRFQLLNAPQFIKKCMNAINAVGDLRPVWVVIARMWYKGNEQLFNKKGPGFYEDYKGKRDTTVRAAYMHMKAKGGSDGMTAYMRLKQRAVGFVYPMMFFYGALSNSITQPGSAGGVAIIEPKSLTLGTTVRYAIYHQFGGETMPYRPVIINRAVTGNYTRRFEKRVANYSRLIDAYMKRTVHKVFGK